MIALKNRGKASHSQRVSADNNSFENIFAFASLVARHVTQSLSHDRVKIYTITQ